MYKNELKKYMDIENSNSKRIRRQIRINQASQKSYKNMF